MAKSVQTITTQVLIIGGGVTGTGLARDLSMRGLQCTLVERKDVNAGASGSNHGLLHSGARYVSSDPLSATQCQKENSLLKKLVPDLVEETGGLFIAMPGDDENYIADFPNYCLKAGVSCKKLTPAEALAMEPRLSDKLLAAYAVEDATIDPFGLSLANINEAKKRDATFHLNTEIIGITKKQGRVQSLKALKRDTAETFLIIPDIVVNAAGAWSGMIASLAGIDLKMIYSKGTLLITNYRLTGRVINRLRPPANADILVPGGTVSILGTTSSRIETLKEYRPQIAEVDTIVDEFIPVVPSLENTRCIRAYAGVRPLIMQKEEGDNDRRVSREFSLFDHSKDGVDNFITITGGKLTTYRYMAEKAADLVCRKLSIDEACTTRQVSLDLASSVSWTYPGISPKIWLRHHEQDDMLMCECEMVSQKAIDSIFHNGEHNNGHKNLKAIGLRSRVGKGTCQGSFCSIRLMAHLYNRGVLRGSQGIDSLKRFIQDRWAGQHTVLWGDQLAQAELSEAMLCGLLGLEE